MEATYTVRHACISDATELLVLMRELARFEGYIEQFCVTEDDLRERGLYDGSKQQFFAFVAETGNGKLLGYALVYAVPRSCTGCPSFQLGVSVASVFRIQRWSEESIDGGCHSCL